MTQKKYIGNLYDDIKVNFPFDDKTKVYVLFGKNCSGKTLTMNLLNSYFPNETNVYFKADRKMMVNEEQVNTNDAISVMFGQRTLRKTLESIYDIYDPFSLQNIQIGDKISCGYLQIINFFYYCKCNYHMNRIKIDNIFIDDFSDNLHPLVIPKLISDLMCYNSNPRLFITLRDESYADSIYRKMCNNHQYVRCYLLHGINNNELVFRNMR